MKGELTMKRFIFKAGILILSLLIIFTLVACDNKGSKTRDTIYSVSGTVLDSNGTPVTDVSLAIKGGKIKDNSVEVDENGKWSAGDLAGEVTITPVKDNWTFNPAEVQVTEKDAGKKDLNFVGEEIIYPGVETLIPEEDVIGVEPGAV